MSTAGTSIACLLKALVSMSAERGRCPSAHHPFLERNRTILYRIPGIRFYFFLPSLQTHSQTMVTSPWTPLSRDNTPANPPVFTPANSHQLQAPVPRTPIKHIIMMTCTKHKTHIMTLARPSQRKKNGSCEINMACSFFCKVTVALADPPVRADQPPHCMSAAYPPDASSTAMSILRA